MVLKFVPRLGIELEQKRNYGAESYIAIPKSRGAGPERAGKN